MEKLVKLIRIGGVFALCVSLGIGYQAFHPLSAQTPEDEEWEYFHDLWGSDRSVTCEIKYCDSRENWCCLEGISNKG